VTGDVSAANITATTFIGALTGLASSATVAASANSVAGANVSGTVANATYATTSGTSYSVSGANVTGTVSLATYATTANAVAGANVSGTVANATYAITSGTSYSVAGANVSGAVGLATFATTSNAIAGANVSGTVANATYAITSGSATTSATVTTAAQPNITSLGTLTSLGVNGTVTAVAFTANTGVFTGNGSGLSAITSANIVGQVTNALVAGTVYTSAQPNITSIGTLTSLAITGNITSGNATLGNLVTANFFTGNGSLLTGIAKATSADSVANGTSNVNIPSINGNINLNVAGNANVAVITGTGVNVAGYLTATGNVAANYFTGNGSLLTGVAASTATSAATAGTVTTAAQPNITSTGTLTGLTVTGNVLFSGANITLGDIANLHISGGTANYVLKTDGSGALSWTAQTSGSSNAAGANTQIQFNDGNIFAGNAGLTFNKTTTVLTANNLAVTASTSLGAVGNITVTGGVGGQVLGTNGSNVLAWITPATTSITSSTGITVDTFVGNGSTVAFTLSVTPATITQTQVNYNGVMQLRSAYTLTGASIVFSEAPISGSSIEVTTTQGVTATSGTYAVRSYIGTGSLTTFTVTTGLTDSSVLVTENGVLQTPTTDYTVSGTVLTFATAPAVGVKIQIRELGIFVVNSAATATTDILSPFLLMGA